MSNIAFRQAMVAAAVAGAAGLMTLLVPQDGGAAMNKEQRKQVMLRTVFIAVGEFEKNDMVMYARGSGTILSHDGAVLTNRHVLWNDKAKKPFGWAAISLTDKFDQKPVQKCLVDPSKAIYRDNLDLALIKCEYDMQGKPYTPNGWPSAVVGSSEDMVPGDEVIIIGYPGIGGETITYTTGKVSGFSDDQGGSGRFWMKTDADISPGNSGGTALDEDGALVGVPSAGWWRKDNLGKVGLVRPIEHARDLINIAKSGWIPGQEPGTGGGNGGFGGNQGGQQQQPQGNGVTIISTVKASDSGKPIAGAVVIVLKPGIKVSQVTKEKLEQQVQTFGQTDSNGRFQTMTPVPRGAQYSVIVVADGFAVLAEDGVLSVDNNAADPLDPWGVIKLDRQ